MTDKEADRLIGWFMKENKKELPDNGFSRRVMRSLPDRERRLSRIWIAICSGIGVLLFFLFDGFNAVLNIGKEIFVSAGTNLGDVNPHYLIVTVLILIGLGLQRIYHFIEE